MRLAAIVVTLLSPALALAQVVPTDREHPVEALPGEGTLPPDVYVTPPAEPTHVGIGVDVHSLDRVDPPSQLFPHFAASLALTLRWRDPRLAFDEAEEGLAAHVYQEAEADRHLREIWHPDVGFENEDADRHVEGRSLTIRADGTVVYQELLSTTFRAHVELLHFPFDEQRFHMAAQSMTWNASNVVLEVLEEETGLRHEEGEDRLEWRDLRLEHDLSRVEAVRSGHPHVRATFSIVAQRAPGFYLWKLILPLLLIVTFTWSTFWMTGEAAGTRLQRAFIALLSVVAYQRVIADHLPRIPYLTWMDAMVYLAFAFTGATVIQIVVSHRYLSTDRAARAARLDVVSRWAFPLAFLLGIAALSLYYRYV